MMANSSSVQSEFEHRASLFFLQLLTHSTRLYFDPAAKRFIFAITVTTTAATSTATAVGREVMRFKILPEKVSRPCSLAVAAYGHSCISGGIGMARPALSPMGNPPSVCYLRGVADPTTKPLLKGLAWITQELI